MLTGAADGLARRGRCTVGDKTILDTLAPAAAELSAALETGVPLGPAWGSAVRAAAAGARSTRSLVARRGLALRLGERSVGHLDPGAVSCLLLLRALGGG
jgi:dihydroxyacetone kinase-like protein